ncbi:fluoride efflux transporter CrcB [Nitratidesulfovibrio sp.]|uniref:fluoride efflux transporter CrcB n=1 Tax=Nitratidesulfovibrio sp. TaxID=2802297 RepID=UPI00333EEABF
MQKIVLLGLAGALGSLARYGLAGLVQRATPGSFPLGTFIVNVLGCLAFGFVWGVCENRISLHPDVRVVLLTGFMGAFTTFSTFTFESLGLMETGQWMAFALYAGGQLLLGLAMVWLGLGTGRLV